MDNNYSRMYSVFAGSIGTIAVPIAGTAAGSLGFTQAQLDDADAILIQVSSAAINIRFDGTVAGTATGGFKVAVDEKLFLRGQNLISKLSFIANGSTGGGFVAATIFGGK
jgi:hypothetical protein